MASDNIGMGISQYIKEIGRGARGAKSLSRSQADDMFGQILDGTVTDLEIGAFCLAMRIKGETADEMCGFLDALHARITAVPSPEDIPTVVIPSYNGARKLPVLTPLLALLLAQRGLPVLVHGMRTEARRVLASDVLEALGVAPYAIGSQVTAASVNHMHTAHLHSGLARLLAVRETVGLRNPGHSVVKLLHPCRGPTILVSSYTHPEYLHMLRSVLTKMGSNAVLSRGLEGEVTADPRRTAHTIGFIRGQEQILQEQQPGTAETVPGLPSAIDIATTAQYTSEVLRGIKPIPPALEQQVEYILRISQHHIHPATAI